MESAALDTAFPEKWSKRCRHEISRTYPVRSSDGRKPPASPEIRPATIHRISNLYAFMKGSPPSRHFPLSPQPIRQMLLDLGAMPAEEPLHVQHTRAVL